MTGYIALLRAINVGGTGKLPMTELRAICQRLGFQSVRTYIASGNVVFHSGEGECKVQELLESALHEYAGKPMGVHIRSAAEIAQVLADNPFPEAPGNRAVVIFLNDPPPSDTPAQARHQARETIALGKREIYVHYPDGQGTSKLVIPAAKQGTARNLNTVAKLAEMAAEL